MRVLVLSSRREGGNINDLIHRGFFDACPGEVIWYGPGEDPYLNLTQMTEKSCELAVPFTEYEKGEPFSTVMCRLKPDLVLVNMKKRVPWLKRDDVALVAKLGVPICLVDVDVWGKHEDPFYKWPWTRIFVRGFIDVAKISGVSPVPVSWLPFSVHPSWINIPTEAKTEFGVGFVGNLEPASLYQARRRAIQKLGRKIVVPKAKVYGVAYMHWWRKCSIGLSCGGTWGYNVAKDLIIPGAGAILLSSGPKGLDKLLPRDAYVVYGPNAQNVVTLVEQTLADKRLLERRIIAAKHVEKFHTHATRWAELLSLAMEAKPC